MGNEISNKIIDEITKKINNPEESFPKISAHIDKSQGNKIVVICNEIDIDKEAYFIFSIENKIVIEKAEQENNEFTIEIPKFDKQINQPEKIICSLYFASEKEGEWNVYRLENDTSDTIPKKNGKYIFDRTNQYYEPIYEMQIEKVDMIEMPYITKFGNLAIMITPKEYRYLTQYIAKFVNVKIDKNILYVKVKCDYPEKNWTGITISYRYKTIDDKEEYFVKPDEAYEKNNNYYMIFRIDLSKYQFRPVQWDIRAVFEEEGYNYKVNLRIKRQLFIDSITNMENSNEYLTDDGYILFPYITGNNAISLYFRKKDKYDCGKLQKIEEKGQKYYKKHQDQIESENLILVYEKYCSMAQDNGYYFFKYCMENNMEKVMNRKIYFVIDKKSPDYKKVKKYKKNVISFMSAKYIAYLIGAKLLVGSDAKNHAYAWRCKQSNISEMLNDKKSVFLQHGVTAFKKVDNLFGRNTANRFDLFVVTSENEKKIVKNFFKYKDEEIGITGFSRWDVLEDCSQNAREILVMPTWRNWLDDVSDDYFKNSEYFNAYMELLNSKELVEILKNNNCRMNYYIHPKFSEYLSNFDNDNEYIRIIPFGSIPLNELLMKSKMLVTDYSSVAWDMLYQKKPVVFYQFDYDKYMEANGSYIDMEKDLFGKRSTKIDDLIIAIQKCIDNDFKIEGRYQKYVEEAFSYIDNLNSLRICQEIQKKGF